MSQNSSTVKWKTHFQLTLLLDGQCCCQVSQTVICFSEQFFFIISQAGLDSVFPLILIIFVWFKNLFNELRHLKVIKRQNSVCVFRGWEGLLWIALWMLFHKTHSGLCSANIFFFLFTQNKTIKHKFKFHFTFHKMVNNKASLSNYEEKKWIYCNTFVLKMSFCLFVFIASITWAVAKSISVRLCSNLFYCVLMIINIYSFLWCPSGIHSCKHAHMHTNIPTGYSEKLYTLFSCALSIFSYCIIQTFVLKFLAVLLSQQANIKWVRIMIQRQWCIQCRSLWTWRYDYFCQFLHILHLQITSPLQGNTYTQRTNSNIYKLRYSREPNSLRNIFWTLKRWRMNTE